MSYGNVLSQGLSSYKSMCKMLGPKLRTGVIHYVISEIQPFNIMHLLHHTAQCQMAALLNELKRLQKEVSLPTLKCYNGTCLEELKGLGRGRGT